MYSYGKNQYSSTCIWSGKIYTSILDSIEKQTLREIEVILVDDGSPDNCPQILDEFVQKDSRYKVIHQKNAGVSMARNAGLAQATGKYVYIVDSDDWLVENALEELGMKPKEQMRI